MEKSKGISTSNLWVVQIYHGCEPTPVYVNKDDADKDAEKHLNEMISYYEELYKNELNGKKLIENMRKDLKSKIEVITLDDAIDNYKDEAVFNATYDDVC
jgi:hypothetical protein